MHVPHPRATDPAHLVRLAPDLPVRLFAPASARRLRLVAVVGITLVAGALVLPAIAAAQDPPADPWSPADFVWPLSATDQIDLPITSPFGPRLQGSQNFAYDYHRGIDIATPIGTPIYAIADGTVRIAGEHPAYRDMLVQLRLERAGQPTLYVNYTHLSAVDVAEDQVVSQGELLGYTGVSESGFAHLHFEIRDGFYQRDARNPLLYLPYADTIGQSAAIRILDTSSSDAGTGRDVVVSVTATKDEVDIDAVSLSLHNGPVVTLPPPDGVAALAGWEFSFQQLNRDQTPIVDGSSDITILDNPVVVLDDEAGTSVRLTPGRYDGRNPPWDVATYEFTFRGVPIPDPATVPFHLAANVRDVRQNQVTTWSSPTDPTAFESNDGLAFHRGAGEPQNLRLAWSGPLDPADELRGDEVLCAPTCTTTIASADAAAGIYELLVDPIIGAQDLIVTVVAGALTDVTGRPTSEATTTFTLDNWAPEVVGTIDVAPNADGWVNQPALITWTAVDPEPSSGFTDPAPEPSLVDQLGIQKYQTDPLCDALGNCRSGTFTIGFDNIAPEVTITSGPAPDSVVPVGEVPPLTCEATDAHAGLDADSCTVTSSTQTIDASTDRVTATATATDLAGNRTALAWSFDVSLGAPEVGARADFRAIGADLDALALDGGDLGQRDVDRVLDAVADLEELDDDQYWDDTTTLNDDEGPRALRFAITAMRSIDKIDHPVTTQAVQSILDSMRLLAVDRMNNAAAVGGDPELLDRAARRLEAGDSLRAGERWARASFYYRFAWYWGREAARAIEEPVLRT